MPKLIEFNTDRLRLRQWCLADRELFSKLNSDPRVMEFFPKTLERHESDAFADRIEQTIAKQGWGLWAVEIVSSGEFIGYVGMSTPTEQLPCSPCVEIGWRLAFSAWGKGYATEAAREVLRVGFEKLNLAEIVSFTTLHNLKSRAVMERIGMRDSNENFDHPSVSADSPLLSHCLYRLPKEQWECLTS